MLAGTAGLLKRLDFTTYLRAAVYAAYEIRLEGKLQHGPMPQHVGAILDGNRRFAKQKRLPQLTMGYQEGAHKVDDMLRWCDEFRIPVVTLWALSTSNLLREEDELSGLLAVLGAKVVDIAERESKKAVARRVRAIGRREILPDFVRKAIQEAERLTANNGPYQLNIAIAYDGRLEIAEAVSRLVSARQATQGKDEPSKITPEEIETYLYTSGLPDPDLIIRTSGEVRLSGFLLWQSAYSEFYFCDAHWPSFRRIDFLRALRSYQQRQRRFGR